jgi:hypothetical protein
MQNIMIFFAQYYEIPGRRGYRGLPGADAAAYFASFSFSSVMVSYKHDKSIVSFLSGILYGR